MNNIINNLINGATKGLGFISVICLFSIIIFGVYAFSDPTHAPEYQDFYIDEDSPLLKLVQKLDLINVSLHEKLQNISDSTNFTNVNNLTSFSEKLDTFTNNISKQLETVNNSVTTKLETISTEIQIIKKTGGENSSVDKDWFCTVFQDKDYSPYSDNCYIPFDPVDYKTDRVWKGPIETKELDICANLPLSDGDQFTVKTDATGSGQWINGDEIKTATFTKGTAYTHKHRDTGTKRINHDRIYDGKCTVKAKIWYEGKSTDYAHVVIGITEIAKI